MNFSHYPLSLHNHNDKWYWDTYDKFLQDRNLNPEGKYRVAYELTEERYFTEFGTNRYSSFESFRVMKHRRQKKK